MVFARSSPRETRGSHFRMLQARVMSGWRWRGGVLRQRLVYNAAARGSGLDDLLGELPDRQFLRVADIDGIISIAHHQPINAFNQVRAITKTAGLLAFSKDGYRLILERLADKRRNHSPIIETHSRTVRVKNAHNACIYFVLTMIGNSKRLGKTLGFIVTAAGANGVDVTPILFGLGMNQRISVDLRCRGQAESGFLMHRQAKSLVSAQGAHLEGLNRQFQIIDRTGR